MRVLILGGTGEARQLARLLGDRPGTHVVTSLAGRVAAPAAPVGEVRTGGFGGVAGLVHHLDAERIDRLVDATHPFAARITAHAVQAAASTGVPLVVLRRPGWEAGPDDDWRRVPDLAAAAAACRERPAGATVLLTVGRGGLAPFVTDAARRYVVRSVDPPPPASLPPQHVVVLGRGPFDVAGERGLLAQHGVTLLVTKDSGGDDAKLVAAREAGLPVVVVDRPPLPPGVAPVTSVTQALRALGHHTKPGRQP